MSFFICRISSRLALVPFSVPREPLRGRERMLKERALSAAQAEATKSVGLIISIGEKYHEAENQEYIYGDLADCVLSTIGDTQRLEKQSIMQK